LQTGSDAAIWERLIAPVEWDTEAEEAPEVIREIKDRLVVLGQTMGVTPDKAEDVAAHLYEVAYGTATRQKDRFLTRAELLRVFHARTHVSMPAATYDALLAIIPQHLATLGADGALPQAVGGTSSAVGRAPPLPSRYYVRGAVLGDIEQRLGVYPILVPAGRNRRGKVHRRRRSCGGVHLKLGLGRSARRPFDRAHRHARSCRRRIDRGKRPHACGAG